MDNHGIIEMMAIKFLYKGKLEKAEKERQLQAAKNQTKVIYGSNTSQAKETTKKAEKKSRV
ncbi:hypothetical protein [Pseudothermotoga thermarum]|uniref:tRNA uridine 5-carboxymethylaminomethyl modification enzyme GidA n=1 Tax=Pseudothermotoga thermarum DSM 5069 TaxID=688269 RepID=F7YW55_9THEM|nr:hypothetical protein [Pseudothermotoga thermarum]AEH50544.1 tRNA uridine 5-carboxymethylaminomethyl modification enzyme GidA [Pseudothermotoga thermarum DSM 5069]